MIGHQTNRLMLPFVLSSQIPKRIVASTEFNESFKDNVQHKIQDHLRHKATKNCQMCGSKDS